MTPANIAKLPVESIWVPTCLDNVINKKIAGVALNRLERWVDWICSRLYCPYNTLYNGKKARVHFFSDPVEKSVESGDSIPLFDRTKEGIANIEHGFGIDCIFLNGSKVRIGQGKVKVVFSKANQTDYVAVEDGESPGLYKIIEQALPSEDNMRPMEKVWKVNGGELHQFRNKRGKLSQAPFYFAEPSSPH